MIAGNRELFAFRRYSAPLSSLESAFQFAGEQIEFRLGIRKEVGRYIEILLLGKLVGIAFVEGCSPAQIIKKVAAEVPL
jgi:hypothetical protein